MTLDLDDILYGFAEELRKQAGDLFDAGNHALFPNVSSQQKWKFARSQNQVHLSDGQHVYSFSAPAGVSEDEEFPLFRQADPGLHAYELGAKSKGLAQVHRADPGSIYFTLQEGYQNPTFTFRHLGGDQWRGAPKVKKARKIQVNPEQVKQAMVEALEKQAVDFNHAIGSFIDNLGNKAARPWELAAENPLTTAGIGAGLGAAYHFGKKHLYNTPEENEQEGVGTLLKRMLIPAGALGIPALATRSLIGKDRLDQNYAIGHGNSNLTVPRE